MTKIQALTEALNKIQVKLQEIEPRFSNSQQKVYEAQEEFHALQSECKKLLVQKQILSDLIISEKEESEENEGIIIDAKFEPEQKSETS